MTCVEATQNLPKPRAAAASVMNALFGACAALQHADNDVSMQQNAANVAQSIWSALDEMERQEAKDHYIAPDIVTYSLCFCATQQQHPSFARSILERGLQASKKQAGSKRRKALAAARRRKPSHQSSNEREDSTSDVTTRILETNLRQVLQDESLRILLDTEDFLVLDKPSGITCYHTMTTTAGKISSKHRKGTTTKDISMEDALLHVNVPLSTLNPDCQGLVHRLDRGTGGIMIWTKTNEMHARLVTCFFLRQVHKQYTALVAPAPDGLSSLASSIPLDSPVHGHTASSRVTLLESYGDAAALLKVEPATGRRHQVRVHLAQELHSPVVLDPLYSVSDEESRAAVDLSAFLPANLLLQEEHLGTTVDATDNKKSKKSRKNKQASQQQQQQQQEPQSKRFFLHASALSIPMLKIDLECSLPEWWQETLESLRSQSFSNNK
ncbi:Ribosomal large subunit pseudouridine synthase D [Seminavis robusta]|uniref:Ribosomal large subunit pseudouridine synthase D n=1 Tax=Seminavis robusta TaxID=568900 RepID=A0A9N8DCH6_9STRA|nr:Ribosomal large subunit pseudouridine synthase D [Seminavis robusta]|eukprot:Sro29_g019180.1 Ribosomal large subunit pseudouridine synthase D (440) ;mRNA; f:96282-97601